MKSDEITIKKSLRDKLTIMICTIIVLCFTFAFLYPILYVIVSSFSVTNSFEFSLKNFSLNGYIALLKEPTLIQGFLNSILYTSVGTLISVSLTVLVAYVLSQPYFRSAKIFAMFFTFTIYFGGGMIPTFLVIKKLGLLNTMWSLILPSCMSVYNIYLLRAHFMNKIPIELQRAALLDGCGHWRYLLKVVLPISSTFLSVIAFYYIVSYWNSYFTAMIYISDFDKLPLASVLNNLLIKNQDVGLSNLSGATIQERQLMEYAAIVFSSAPISTICSVSCATREASFNISSR